MATQPATPRFVATDARRLGFWGSTVLFFAVLIPLVLAGVWLESSFGVPRYATLIAQILAIGAFFVLEHWFNYGPIVRRADATDGVMCTQCGYDMRDHAHSTHCPKCGASWDEDHAREIWAAWSKRNRIVPSRR